MSYAAVVDPWTRPPDEGSDAWNATLFVSHCGFFALNLFNLAYILLFEGFVFRRLMRNRLLKIGVWATVLQLASCVTSLHRYNIDDEYGAYGRAGTIMTLIASVPLNVVYVYLIFPRNSRAILCGWAVWIVPPAAILILGEVNSEEDFNFHYVRAYTGAYGVYQTLALAVGHSHLKRGRIGVDPSVISKAEMLRLFKLLFLIDLGALIVAATRLQLYLYPATGTFWTTMVIAMTFVGRMDFMMGEGKTRLTESTYGDEPVPGKKDALETGAQESSSGADLDRNRATSRGLAIKVFNVEGTSNQSFRSDDSFVGDIDIEAPMMMQCSPEETPGQMVKNLQSVVESLTDQWSQLKEATERASKSGSETVDSAPPAEDVHESKNEDNAAGTGPRGRRRTSLGGPTQDWESLNADQLRRKASLLLQEDASVEGSASQYLSDPANDDEGGRTFKGIGGSKDVPLMSAKARGGGGGENDGGRDDGAAVAMQDDDNRESASRGLDFALRESNEVLDINMYDISTTSESTGEDSAPKPSVRKSASELTVEGPVARRERLRRERRARRPLGAAKKEKLGSTSEPKEEEFVLRPSVQKSLSELTVEGMGGSGSKRAPAVKRATKKKRASGKHVLQRRDSVDPPGQEQGAAKASRVRLAGVDPPSASEPTTRKNVVSFMSGAGGHRLPGSDDSSAGSGYATPDE